MQRGPGLRWRVVVLGLKIPLVSRRIPRAVVEYSGICAESGHDGANEENDGGESRLAKV